jgi:thiol-disulfide isomerase/thioredoxin
MAWRSLAAVMLALLLGSAPSPAAAEVVDLSFAEAEAATTQQQLIVFAAGQDAQLRGLLEEVSAFSSSFIYVYVDCEDAASRDKCASADFSADNLPRVFVNSVEGGIETISGPPNKAAMLDFLEFRSSPVAGERVVFAESDAHFAELLGRGRHVAVKYYQTWCSHCKRFKKHFEQSSTLFGSSAPVEVLFVEVDCGVTEKTCRDHGVSSYPTLKFYDANSDMRESPVKARDHQELTAFLQKTAAPLAKVGR